MWPFILWLAFGWVGSALFWFDTQAMDYGCYGSRGYYDENDEWQRRYAYEFTYGAAVGVLVGGLFGPIALVVGFVGFVIACVEGDISLGALWSKPIFRRKR